MADRQYRAFISYSHRDKAVANWLHRALETYRLPRGSVPPGMADRLQPIFKDREELPATDSLSAAIEQAIAASSALIVLCSPDAAKSRWIAREVDTFKRLHGDRNVFPVIVAGQAPGIFPAPLLVRYQDGAPTDQRAEPIAADLRPEGDGRKLAKLKLVAGLTGIHLDALVQRDAARRQRRLALVAAGSLAGMVVTSGLALYAIDQRNEAREQRAEADGLIEYMLTDLRQQLEPVGRLELLDGVGKRAMDYYARQKLEDLSATELGRRARATMLVAEVQNLRGNNEAALPAFREAARTTAALLARKPDDPERMFNHGQSLFWVGYIAWQHGKLSEARKAMEAYADISTRLAAKDRANLDWQMEEAYSLSNLGTMDFEEGKLASALDYFERHVAAIDAISAREGRKFEREFELAGGLSWISTTLHSLGRIDQATAVRRQEIAAYDRLIAIQPDNAEVKRTRVYAAGYLGRLLAVTGKRAEARRVLDQAIAEGQTQIGTDPDNTLSRELAWKALRDRALLAWSDGDAPLARRLFDQAEAVVAELRRRDPDNRDWNIDATADLQLHQALTVASGDSWQVLQSTAARWSRQLDKGNLQHGWMVVASDLIRAEMLARQGKAGEARAAYARVASATAAQGELFDYGAIALRAVAAERAGNRAEARRLRAALRQAGIDPLIDDRLGASRT